MTSPAVELQKAIFGRLSGDPGLTARLGGAKIYDAAPPKAAFPYITFGRTTAYDWSTDTEKGAEQLFTAHVWSQARGKTETLEIMETVRQLLDGAELDLTGHHLVSLQLEFAEARFDDDVAVHHGLLRFRALTEPA